MKPRYFWYCPNCGPRLLPKANGLPREEGYRYNSGFQLCNECKTPLVKKKTIGTAVAIWAEEPVPFSRGVCEHCDQTIIILDDHRVRVTHGVPEVNGHPLELCQGCCNGIIPDGPYKGREGFLKPANSGACMIVGEEVA